MNALTLDREGDRDAVALQPQLLSGVGDTTKDLGPIWIVEEAAGHLRTQGKKGPLPQLRLYRLRGDVLTVVDYADLTPEVKRPDAVMSMLHKASATEGVVVCSYRAAAVPRLAELLEAHGRLNYVLEVDPARSLEFDRARKGVRVVAPKVRAEDASWAFGLHWQKLQFDAWRCLGCRGGHYLLR